MKNHIWIPNIKKKIKLMTNGIEMISMVIMIITGKNLLSRVLKKLKNKDKRMIEKCKNISKL